MAEPTAWRVHVESMPGLTRSQQVLESVADTFENDRRVSGPSVSLNTETGVLGATVAIDEPRRGAATDVAIEAFYDALREAGFRVDMPGWRLFLEIEPIFPEEEARLASADEG